MRFVQEELYHVYNRGNNGQRIFFDDENYRFFQQKLATELLYYCDILAYCLMPNHYHLVIHIKPNTTGVSDEDYSRKLSRKLGTLQSSYTQAINKRFKKSGTLFQQKVKSKNLNRYADICFHYVHQNPIEAGLVEKMEDWQYSSFQHYLRSGQGNLIKKQLAYDLLDIPESPDQFYKESLGVIVSHKLKHIW